MKKIISVFLAAAIMLSLLVGLAGCVGKVTTPQLRINTETNYWEVSYDEGHSWVSMGVKATGENGKDGADGKDGINGTDGKPGENGTDGKDGINGTDGKDGVNGTNGTDGANGTNGATPHIGADGYWYIGDVNTGIYAGSSEQVTVTFMVSGEPQKVHVAKDSKVSYWAPSVLMGQFEGWYTDSACTIPYNFNNPVSQDITVYAKGGVTAQKVQDMVLQRLQNTELGSANCFGTTACFGSVHFRVLMDDHGYYAGAQGIANYLGDVFVETDGVVSVSQDSTLRGISYCDSLTIINFALAFGCYEEYIIRNNLTLSAELAAQKALALKYFNTVDNTAEGYHDYSVGIFGMTFPSTSTAVVALGSIFQQTETERFKTLAKDSYDNYDPNYWNNTVNYTVAISQVWSHFDWYDTSKIPELTDADPYKIIDQYAYGVNVQEKYPTLWNEFLTTALADDTLTLANAKALAYHYAYQATGGEAWLGAFGGTRAVVDNRARLWASEGLELTRNDNGYTVTGIGTCTDTNIVLPEEYEGLPVTAVSNNAFRYNNDIHSVYIPGNIKTVGNSAFNWCQNLEEVTVADGVVILGESTFAQCKKLRNVVLPDSVTMLNGYCFQGCGMDTITLGSGLKSLGYGALWGNPFTEIVFRGTVEQWNAVEINDQWWNDDFAESCVIRCSDGTVDPFAE